MNYGIPYMGSKSKICEKVCALFPRAENFYDLFGGGFSVTHFMVKHRFSHYKKFHFNELRSGMTELIKSAIRGDFNYEKYNPEWVSRERFERDKEEDLFIKIVWSFGNNGKGYLFGKDIEGLKRSMHMAIVFNEFDQYAKNVFGVDKFAEGFSITQKRLYLENRIRFLGSDNMNLERLQQNIEEKINFYNESYEKVPIEKDSVIYCDIPYGGTAEYDKSSSSFDRKNFFNWANGQDNPVFISEYNVEDKRFRCIANFKKRSMLNKDKSTTLIKTEKVYVNNAGYIKLMSNRTK